MSGSGSGSQRRRFPRSRLVNTHGGVDAYGYACGRNACDTARFDARLVNTHGGVDVYAFASECRHPLDPNNRVAQFVQTPCAPPWGVSDRLLVELLVQSGIDCWNNACERVELAYDSLAGKWTGSVALAIGTLSLEGACSAIGFTLTFTGACMNVGSGAPPVGQTTPVTCLYPYRSGGSVPITFKGSCCFDGRDQTVMLTYNVYGYTLDRYVGRLVDVVGGVDVYRIGECCDDYQCVATDNCCGCLTSPRVWQFAVAGVASAADCPQCPAFNATWRIVYVGGCRWETSHPDICTPGPPWTLFCDGVNWVLNTSSALGAATYTLSIGSWQCFGPNVMTRIADHGKCSGFPATITLLAA